MKIDHIGIAVKNIEEAARVYTEGLGIALARIEAVPQQGVKVGFLPVGDTELELLEPLSAECSVAQCIEKRGEGVHHICIEVDDIAAAMARLRAQGARLLSEQPTQGAGGAWIAFVHPRSASGVLIELLQKPSQ
jgi:methylmalonyl-CoA epimerase